MPEPNPNAARFMTFYVPEDRPEFLAAFGTVAITHGHLDHQLRLLIKTLARVSVDEAVRATARDASSELRRIARKLSRTAFGECAVHLRVCALLKRAEETTEKRNDLLHAICAQEQNMEALARDEAVPGEPYLLNDSLERRPLPEPAELLAIASSITALVNEVNHERLHGFIAEAIAIKGRELS
jgi:hypothetical protein